MSVEEDNAKREALEHELALERERPWPVRAWNALQDAKDRHPYATQAIRFGLAAALVASAVARACAG